MPRPAGVERDPAGLPVVGGLERRLSLALVVLATLWFGVAAAWEIAGPILAGHYASSASVGIIADNMLHWRILGPVWEYTPRRPPPALYYCHHPWGIFWTTTLLAKVFGRHDFVCRLAPVLLSAATPPLLFALGRAIWRPAAGAIAAVAFVVLPISLAFANFNALEVPVIAWSLVGLWGFVRHTQTAKRRHLAASLAGFVLALNADWPAYVLVGVLLGFGLVRGLVLRRRPFGPVAVRPYAQWWALLATATVATGLGYVALFHHAGGLVGLLQSYAMRAAGSEASWTTVLAARRYWLELCFTPIAIGLGGLGMVVSVARLLVRRYDHEIVPLAVLVMAAVQYFVFKQGADIHVFWPHYFALFFALAMGLLTDTAFGLPPLVRRIGARVARWRRPAAARSRSPVSDQSPALGPAGRIVWARMRGHWTAPVVMIVMLLPLLAIARDGIPALGYARGTGGRFNEKGLFIESDGVKTAVLRWLAPQLSPGAVVGMHDSMRATWAQVWALGGRIVKQGQAVPRAGVGPEVYLADVRFMADAHQVKLARDHHVQALGPVWRVSPQDPSAPIDAYAIVEREPGWLERYFVSGTEPVRTLEPDPFATWELRTHFEQPASPPTIEPLGFEQRRIAHNVALATGDGHRADDLARGLGAELMGPVVVLEDGTELVGQRFDDGVQPVLTLLFRAAGPSSGGVDLHVRSRVVAPAPLSSTMADPTVRELSAPLALSPTRWRAGWLYAHRVVVRRRPGTEVFELAWRVPGSGGAPSARGRAGVPPVELLRLE